MNDRIVPSGVVATRNIIWKFLESFLSKGVSMIIQIILARLLFPEDFGIIALTGIFIQLSDILIQAGFGTALIQKESIEPEDYSTTLVISVMLACFLYIIIYILSPFVAEYYHKPVLSSVLKVLSLMLFCQAFTSVRTAVISRQMKFKTLFFWTSISNVISGVIGVICAYLSFGVWSLVVQQLLQQLLLCALIYYAVDIKIICCFSWQSAKDVLPLSIKILLSSLLCFVGDSIFSLAIGKYYTMSELGFYTKGGQFPMQFSLYTFGAISSVLLPLFASYNQDYEKLSQITRKVIFLTCYIIFPMMAGLSISAKPFVTLVLTSKWLPCTTILRWSCLYYLVTPLLLVSVQLQFAIGRGDIRIKAELLRLMLLLVAFVIILKCHFSINWIAAIVAIIQIIEVIYMSLVTIKIIRYKVYDSFIDIYPTILSTALMSIVLCLIVTLPLQPLVLLITEFIVGVTIYLSCSYLLKNKAYLYLTDILHSMSDRRFIK